MGLGVVLVFRTRQVFSWSSYESVGGYAVAYAKERMPQGKAERTMAGQILIVDDHAFVRRGLRALLSTRPEWSVCGEAADGLEAVEKAKALRPDVVLMDISMPRMSGIEASRIIRREVPES